MTMVRRSPAGMASLFDGAEGMEDIAEIIGRMKANVPHPASTSSKLWTLRRATRIASHHRGRETLLEKAVAMLAANGHMPGWFNQCPAASGIGDSSRNRRSNIDLVHWSEADGHARLVELKWNSDDPSEAMRQILRYGAAYLFCRAYSDRLPVGRRAVLEAREISLQVAAPARYYTEPPWRDGLLRARECLTRFVSGSRVEGLSLSLDVLAFPEWFDSLPFADGEGVRAACDTAALTEAGRRVRDAFDGLVSVHPEGRQGAKAAGARCGGRVDSTQTKPVSAKADRARAEVRFPWSGGRHPVLDCLVTTPSALIGIESKRYEPFRGMPRSAWSDAYWRPVWGECMQGYESVRDGLCGEPGGYEHLEAAQLVKHAFALRTAVHERPECRALAPVLYYVYAEPESWPNGGAPVDEGAKARHREEIERFAAAVAGDEVAFVSCSWPRLLETWARHEHGRIRAHAAAVAARFAP